MWKSFARVLRELCESFVRVLRQFCASSARVLRQFCDSFATVLRELCESCARVSRNFCKNAFWFLLRRSLRTFDRRRLHCEDSCSSFADGGRVASHMLTPPIRGIPVSGWRCTTTAVPAAAAVRSSCNRCGPISKATATFAVTAQLKRCYLAFPIRPNY